MAQPRGDLAKGMRSSLAITSRYGGQFETKNLILLVQLEKAAENFKSKGADIVLDRILCFALTGEEWR